MIFLKLIGCAILIFSGVAGGFFLNRQANLGIVQSRAMMTLIGYIKNSIECFSKPLPRILHEIKNDRALEGIFEECGYAEGVYPLALSELCGDRNVYSKEADEVFSSFLRDFGQSYRDEQVKLCESVEKKLEEILKKSKDELLSKKKLNLSLCVSGSLIAVILFI